MSFVSKEDRPKLKAKRFNKFELSSNSRRIEEGDIYNIPKKGCKRLCADDLNYSVKHKRICTTASLNTSPPTKNLANNRLKNLKQQIQETLKTDKIDQKKTNNVSTKSILYSRETEHRENECDILIKKEIFDKKNVTHELKDKFSKSAEGTPLIRPRKNLADERLQNIKKKLKSRSFDTKSPSNLSNETKICNSTLQSPHCSSWRSNEDKKSTSLKRNINNVTNTCDQEGGSNYKKLLSKRNVSPSKIIESTSPSRIEQNNSTLKENVIKSTFSPPFGINTFACSTPISKRLLNVKGDEYFSRNVELPKSQSSPTLQRLDQEDKCSAIQKLVTPVKNNEENKSNVIGDSSDNFLNKIEMTTSWIKVHQDQYKFNTSARSPNYCLNETKEQDSTKFDDGTEEMEWTNAEPDDEVTELNKVTESSIKDKELTEIIKDPEKIKDVCIVVDTNVFISGLSKIRDIVNIKTTGSFKPIIFVPWMVITELDYMKDSNTSHKLLKNVTNAIKFINVALNDNNPQVVGQTVFDVEKQKHIGASPDDKIVSCCLQAAEKYETVILLSNDMNIKNKAMINGITACSLNEIMIKLMSKLVKNTKTQKIMHKMGIMCSSIICDCMKAAYGDIWSKMDMMSTPPWSLAECLKRFKKYWTAVFREKLMKQFTKTLQSLLDVIESNKCMSDDSVEFVEFMKLCVALCVFLKDIEECRGFVECTLADITKTA